MLKAEEDFVLFKIRISEDLIIKALVIFVITVSAISVLSAILVLLEPDKRPIDIVFEAVSAFCTVGLSMGVTPGLSVAGKLFVIIAMIFGRLGILAFIITMLTSVTEHKNIKYPESRILVG
jgi:trk system potassium uptake protein TrkH